MADIKDIPRIIDMVLAKRKRMMKDPDEAIRNSALAIAAIHGGVRSPAWTAYMMQFVAQSPLGKPVDDRQLKRLLATDGTAGNPKLDRHRAYLVGNGPCGPTTPELVHRTVNSIDDQIGDDLPSCLSDAEMKKAVPEDAQADRRMRRSVTYKSK